MREQQNATPCACRKDIEQKLTERFKEQAPEATDHEAKLTGFAFVFMDHGLESKRCMPLELTATYPLKKGGTKRKTMKQNMMFSFCPFCGQQYPTKAGAA